MKLPLFLQPDTFIKPTIVARHPAADHPRGRPSFPNGLELYVFPSGATLSEQRNRATSHTFVLTDVNGGFLYAFCSVMPVLMNETQLTTIQKQISMKTPEMTFEKGLPTEVWGLSALVIVSLQPLHTSMLNYLSAYLRELGNQRGHITAESCAFVFDELSEWHRQRLATPLESLTVTKSNTAIQFPAIQNSRPGEMSVSDLDFRLLFSLIHPRAIVCVLEALLSETPVLLISGEIGLLTECMEIFLTLMYPMEWPFTKISILPLSLSDFLDVPQPYFMGTLDFVYMGPTISLIVRCRPLDQGAGPRNHLGNFTNTSTYPRGADDNLVSSIIRFICQSIYQSINLPLYLLGRGSGAQRTVHGQASLFERGGAGGGQPHAGSARGSPRAGLHALRRRGADHACVD
jgi:hypothetical protein